MQDQESFVDAYLGSTKLKLLIIAALSLLAVAAAFWSLSTEAAGLSMTEALGYLWDHITGKEYAPGTPDYFLCTYIWEYKAPRVLFAIFAGTGLAVAGVCMQGIMNNPLADPYTTGISSGACLGIAVASVLGISIGSYGSDLQMIVFCLLMSMIPTAVIVMAAPRASISPSTLILVGVALSYLFNSISTFIMVTMDDESLATIYQWQVGSVASTGWDGVIVTAIIATVGAIIIMAMSRQLNVLALGDKAATSLGLDTESLRIICLFIIALIIAVIVACAGIIGFVGLMAPHIIRMILGSDNKFVIPASIAFSVFFLLACDAASLIISPLGAVPLGTVVSVIGAPVFLMLIVRRNSNVWRGGVLRQAQEVDNDRGPRRGPYGHHHRLLRIREPVQLFVRGGHGHHHQAPGGAPDRRLQGLSAQQPGLRGDPPPRHRMRNRRRHTGHRRSRDAVHRPQPPG